MATYHIHITGLVQGVGFRPFVYNLALQWNLNGWVKNTTDGVHIRFNSDKKNAILFFEDVIKKAPSLSIITDQNLLQVADEDFQEFDIIHSDAKKKAKLLLTPDFAMCQDCKIELEKVGNRRYTYPFITCTNCGPRYSIIRGLPYDRPLTTMESFPMCDACHNEYNDPLDRRYFSQTNSCPDCAIEMQLFNKEENGKLEIIEEKNPQKQVGIIIKSLKNGKIVAIKGIGGFLLMADASQKRVVDKLRLRKNRPSKAFAIMFPDIKNLAGVMYLHDQAREFLKGPVSPIVLLAPKKEAKFVINSKVAPGLDKLGVMLPYTPLFEMIMKGFGKALIATSGNLSNEPIVYDNEEAMEKLEQFADLIVINNREIVVPQDDSVISFSRVKQKKIILRRSRGLAPGYFDPKLSLPEKSILAFGADMKSSFCLAYNGIPFISQYLGDLGDFGTQQAFSHTLDHFLKLFKTKPEVILHDLHPNYFSTQLAEELFDPDIMGLKAIQHHEAHFTSVMGEHMLFDSEEKVLGVIWDGTGLGKDGHVWGAEFFNHENKRIERISHLEYFDFILGDKMPKEPRISALSICKGSKELEAHIKDKFSQREWIVYSRFLEEKVELQTSSMGRLFDAVSSILMDHDRSSYEGEAAMFLEVEAANYAEKIEYKYFVTYGDEIFVGNRLSSHALVKKILEDLKGGKAKNEIAYKFHCSLINWIEKVLKEGAYQKLCFSGGVFQNALLVDLIHLKFEDNYELFFHEKLSPNDECISFGQLMHYLHIEA